MIRGGRVRCLLIGFPRQSFADDRRVVTPHGLAKEAMFLLISPSLYQSICLFFVYRLPDLFLYTHFLCKLTHFPNICLVSAVVKGFVNNRAINRLLMFRKQAGFPKCRSDLDLSTPPLIHSSLDG